MGYAIVAGVEWVVLTDGNEYRIYNTHAPVPVAEKLFHSVRVTDEDASVSEILDLLSRGGQPKDRLKAQWHAHFVDRQVKGPEEAVRPGAGRVLRELVERGHGRSHGRGCGCKLRRVRRDFVFPLVSQRD